MLCAYLYVPHPNEIIISVIFLLNPLTITYPARAYTYVHEIPLKLLKLFPIHIMKRKEVKKKVLSSRHFSVNAMSVIALNSE